MTLLGGPGAFWSTNDRTNVRYKWVRRLCGPGTPAARACDHQGRNIDRGRGVTRRVKTDRQPIAFVLLRTAGFLALALVLILVLFPAALAAQSIRNT